MVLFYLLTFFLLSIIRSKQLFVNTSSLFAFLLTQSKAVVMFLPIFAVRAFFKLTTWQRIAFIIAIVVITRFLVLNWVLPFATTYFAKADSIGSVVAQYNTGYILQNLTFGRSTFAGSFFQYSDKSIGEWIFGSGFEQGYAYVGGKEGQAKGIEMDLFDTFNQYGLIGLVLLIGFYYVPVFRLRIPRSSKAIFLVVIFYSLFGGHLMNPLCGAYYGLLLGLLKNKNRETIGAFFEIRNGYKYSCAV
jgi:hypothetical protein